MKCSKCNGTGFIYYEDENFSEACEDCICKGICPKCGSTLDTYESIHNLTQDVTYEWLVCSNCGFKEDV